jgi:hypothetical protein
MSNEDSDPFPIPHDDEHFLASADPGGTGNWFLVDAGVQLQWYLALRQQGVVPLDQFLSLIPKAHVPSVGNWYIALTQLDESFEFAPGVSLPSTAAWQVSREGAVPLYADVDGPVSAISGLSEHWPTGTLHEKRVLVVGTGSIGAATASSLGSYGVGSVDLFDPDRLEYHNVPRHIAAAKDVGRLKVEITADMLRRAWPETEPTAFPYDAIYDADVLRPLMQQADAVVCTVDGVEPRRIVSYLAKRFGKPLILACVLANGRFGEIIRLRPFAEVGCLSCQRKSLAASGGIDVESSLDRGYGEGTRHNPMTAIGGDLHLMGALTAKVAVSTLLTGSADQRLEEDVAVIALRPEPGYAPPFSASRVLNINWNRAVKPFPDCKTCKPDE